MFVAVHARIATVKRYMCGTERVLPLLAVVVVGVERSAQVVERQHQYDHQHQQPARDPPNAAHTAGAA